IILQTIAANITNLAKKEGGLGIRDLVFWNRACSIKLLWLLFFRAGSIWVAWFIKNILSGQVNNLWTIKEKPSHSSATKKILRVRDYAYNWIKILPGNGKDTRFWSDNWSPFGNLRTYLQLPASSNIGIHHSATLHDLFRNDHWRLPHPRSERQLSLHVYLSTVTLSAESDVYEWSPQGRRKPISLLKNAPAVVSKLKASTSFVRLFTSFTMGSIVFL
ncbi:hypothetical protein HID58_035872, partial [Brassica napus]